jgi:fidgetin-like protein 1
MQCKERVDLLEALKQSREDKASDSAPTHEPAGKIVKPPSRSRPRSSEVERSEPGYIGNGTIPAVNYPDLSRPRPPLPPQRPSIAPRRSSERAVVGGRLTSLPSYTASPSKDATSSSSPSLAPPPKRSSRSPSPEKGRTMLHTLRGSDRSRKKSNPKSEAKKPEMSVTNKAASLAWQSVGKRGRDKLGRSHDPELVTSNSALSDSSRKGSSSDPITGMLGSSSHVRYDNKTRTLVPDSSPKPHSQTDLLRGTNESVGATDPFNAYPFPPSGTGKSSAISGSTATSSSLHDLVDLDPLTLSTSENIPRRKRTPPPPPLRSKPKFEPVSYPTYLREYPETGAKTKAKGEAEELPLRRKPVIKENANIVPSIASSRLSRKPIEGDIQPKRSRATDAKDVDTSSLSFDDDTSSEGKAAKSKKMQTQKQKGKQNQEELVLADPTTPSDDSEDSNAEVVRNAWKEKTVQLLKNLPTGIDDVAAKQILNEIVVQGDVVHWGDIAGLEIAKKSLKEAVVYPFLRPDLFMGLREPARGMLLFGPPGTGKTMLARAVATESMSTFFSISASSLISKYLGESEKLVRALFALAKALAPSIIFVDEIDSLLSARSGSGEHETTRRIKTEFLIQWSDLQRAAAGREQSEKDKEKGDASRVLVLAATNLPWAIDEAARRRFVRRQYIPLPEDETRATQLRTLLGHQKHSLNEADIQKLVVLTDGASFLSSVSIFY